MHGLCPWIRGPAPPDPAHVRCVNTYRELEHFLIHFLSHSYLLNYHVNPTQLLGCLAVRITRILEDMGAELEVDITEFVNSAAKSP